MFELLELLKLTPSGGNQQAWNINIQSSNQFHVVELSISVPKKAEYTDAFSFGRLISLGMLQYSIAYLADDLNLKILNSKIHFSKSSSVPIIEIKIEKTTKKSLTHSSEKIQTFKRRFTNRSLYLEKSIEQFILDKLLTNNKNLSILTNIEVSKAIDLQKKLSLIRFQNKFLFKEMLAEITNQPKETGIPIQNLGLNFLMRSTIKLSKLLPLTLPFEFFYSYPIYQSITLPMQQSANICVISENSDDLTSWINLGNQFMKTWLELTERNIHLQPIGSTLILSNYFKNTKQFAFSIKHQKILHDLEFFSANNTLIDLKKPNIFFRIGYSNIPFLATPRKQTELDYNSIKALAKIL